VLGFQEGGQIKNFQEGDMVEADGEQVIPLSSVTDDPGVVQKVTNFLKDNKQEIALGAGLALTFVPYVGPAIRLATGARGLGALGSTLRGVPQGLKNLKGFLQGKTARPASESRIGRAVQSAYSRPRTSGSQSQITRPGQRPVSARDAEAQGLRLNREFAPGRASSFIAGPTTLGIAALMGGGDDEVEAARQPTPQEMLGSAVFQREDAPAAMFRAGDTSTQRRQGSRGGGQGAASRLGSALTSDKAQQLYSAFQDLGLAGGASRGFEGAQLTSALTQRDLAQQETAARDRALDIDEQTLQLATDTARNEYIQNIFNSSAFFELSQEIADQMGKPRSDPEVLQETLKILMGVGPTTGANEGNPLIEDARRVIHCNLAS
jgi:hypothetical protein